jgi:hypothetical protein
MSYTITGLDSFYLINLLKLKFRRKLKLYGLYFILDSLKQYCLLCLIQNHRVSQIATSHFNHQVVSLLSLFHCTGKETVLKCLSHVKLYQNYPNFDVIMKFTVIHFCRLKFSHMLDIMLYIIK